MAPAFPFRRTLAALLPLSVLASTPLPSVAEEASQRQVSRVARDFAYRRLEAANDLLADGKYEAALAQLRDLEASERANEYERALMHQSFGFVYYAMGDHGRSARSFEKIGTGILQPHAELNVLYNLGQLYVVLERTDEAIATFERWFRLARNPSPQAHVALANAYVQAGRYADALPLVEKACAASSEPDESWLQLLVALHTEQQSWDRAANALKALLERFPRRTYWIQLSAVYAQLGRDRDAMIALELGNVQTPLSRSSEVTRLAHLLLQNEIPYKAAGVLEKGISDGRVAADAKSYELLALSLLQAREIDSALAPLEKAASLSSDADLWLRLAHLRITREEWGEANRALEQAEARGDLDRPGMAALLAGIARLNQGELEPAAEAFERARSYPDTERTAGEYLTYLETLRAREDAKAEGDSSPAAPAP